MGVRGAFGTHQVAGGFAAADEAGGAAADQDLRGAAAGVVVRSQGHAVGAGVEQGDQVADGERRHLAVAREHVAALADRPDDIPCARLSIARMDRLDAVIRAIERRPNQLAHAGVEHRKLPAVGVSLRIHHPRDQRARVADDSAARFEHDSRDHRFGATKGLHLVVEGDYYPITWASGGDAFGSVEGTVSTYLTPIQPGRLTLALRAGGRRVWGEFPYFEAAFLGGKSDLRGYPSERFAGHGSLFGNAELRIGVANVEVFLPAEFGIFGLADAGRVFFEDDPSSSWHTDFGGGITLGFLQRSAGLRVGMARGSEGVRFHLRFGMDF